MKFFITVIGMVMILEGIPYFTMPDRVKEVAAIILTSRGRSLRLIGAFLMVAGLVLVALGRA